MKRVWKVVKILLFSAGSLASLIIILALTSAPFWIWYGLGTKKAGINRPPDYIILLGGGGMPSESGLIRCYYTAIAGNYFTHAKIIVALPGDVNDSLSSLQLMRKELIMRGISTERVLLEDSGTNTRSQAINIELRMRNEELGIHKKHSSLLIVTSPEHLYRAVLAFKKVGFLKVDGLPTFEQAIESNLTFNSQKLGGRKMIPDIGNNITLRYQFWTQMNYEFLVFREWLALTYYWLMGWV